MKQIQGIVLAILDKFTVIIDRGRQHGIEEDDVVIIFTDGPMISDLEGKDVEHVRIPKRQLCVVVVQDKISHVSSYERISGLPVDFGETSTMFAIHGLSEIATKSDQTVKLDEQSRVNSIQWEKIHVGDKFYIQEKQQPNSVHNEIVDEVV